MNIQNSNNNNFLLNSNVHFKLNNNFNFNLVLMGNQTTTAGEKGLSLDSLDERDKLYGFTNVFYIKIYIIDKQYLLCEFCDAKPVLTKIF